MSIISIMWMPRMPEMCIRDRFSDDLRKIDDENVYRKMQGHWIIEMSEMIATAPFFYFHFTNTSIGEITVRQHFNL